MKRSLLLLLAFGISFQSWCQHGDSFETSESLLRTKVNSVYLEAGGKGILGSINYEHIFALSDNQAVSLGISGGCRRNRLNRKQ